MVLKRRGAQAQHAPVPARTNWRYKPVAIKLPFLVVFLSLFVVCIGLIEGLLAISSRPASGDDPATSIKSSRDAKRAEASCINESGWSSQLSPLGSSYAQLCADFSKTLAPPPTSEQLAIASPTTTWDAWNDSLSELLALTSNPAITETSVSRTAPGAVLSTITLSESTIALLRTVPTQMVEASKSSTRIKAPTGTVEEAFSSISTLSQSSKLANVVGAYSDEGTAADYGTLNQSSRKPNVVAASSEEGTAAEHTTVTQFTTMIATTEAGIATSFPAVVKQTIVLDTVPTSAEEGLKATDAASTSSRGKVNFHLSAHEVMVEQPFTNISYFAALYSAPLLAVLIKSVYEIVFAALNLFQPFHYLSSPAGSATCYSVLAQYLSSSISLDVFGSFIHGHFLPLWSTVMYLLVGIGAPVASASMSVRARDICLIGGIERRCDPAWVIDTTVIRIVEGLLGLCALLISVLIASTWYETLGLPCNPSSIISLATLLNHEPFIQDLIRIDPEARDSEFNAAFGKHHFWLASHQNTITATQHYGIIGYDGSNAKQVAQLTSFRQSEVTYVSAVNTAKGIAFATSHPPNPLSFPLASSNQRLRTLFTDTACLLTCLTFFSILLAYVLDHRADGFNSFFNSQRILPKIMFVGLAILVDGQIKYLERVIRITEPYRRLSFGHARAETTILLPINGTCWSNLPRCIYCLFRYSDSRMLWQTTASIVACLSDFNIVVAAGVLFTDAQTPQAFHACSYVAAIITSCILLMVLVTVLWWRRVEVVRDMPRLPETIGAVLSYLCGSAVLREWLVEMEFEDMSEKQRNRTVVDSGRRFKFGRMLSMVDEKVRWCVDFDDGVRHDEKVDLGSGRTSQ